MKSSNIGGQAVIEGVMMKNKERYAVAVRKPDGEIEVTTDTYKSVVGKYTALTKLPLGGISVMNDIKRLYRYHGAEHKCINCIEHGLPLTVENVRKSSKEHKRCGTSFMLFVMIVGIVLLFFVRVESPLMRVIVRIALLPVIAGISYELIKWAGSSENPVVCILSKPGLWLQGLTTKEPDDEMIEVGIAAVEAVFDWKAYLRENFGYKEEE